MKVVKAKERFWLHTALYCQLWMIQRKGSTSYNHLWYQV